MRLISINVIKTGMVIGRPIWNEAGLPLIQKDVVVTDGLINRLKQLGIQYVYIEDKISEGIEIEETVPLAVRKKAVKQITDAFQKLKGLDNKSATHVIDKQTKEIGNLVDDLLSSILNADEILMILSDTMLYDEYIFQHSFQVTLYSLAIAKEMGYSESDLRTIGIGAILHDVGKMVTPSEILFKPGRLTDEEFETMKQHARSGFDILRNLHTVSLLVAHCAFQHHERMDGSGYPRALVDYEIHPFAKVIAVADVFDAVTSNRVYREKMVPSQGIAIIEAGRGTMFDAKVVDALKKSVVHFPNGTILLFSDGRRGVVVKQNDQNAALPCVRIFEENNELLKTTYQLDLIDEQNITIEKVDTEYISEIE